MPARHQHGYRRQRQAELGIPFNPANMISLALILGIGVDVGVHLTHEMRRQRGPFKLTDATTQQAAVLMIHGGFRHLPLMEGDDVVGMLSIRDLMRVVLDNAAPRGV